MWAADLKEREIDGVACSWLCMSMPPRRIRLLVVPQFVTDDKAGQLPVQTDFEQIL